MKKRPSFLLFLGIFLAILCIADVVVFQAIAFTFSIQNTTALITLTSILGFFTVSFVASTILGMRFYNIYTRFYYTLSAIWMGGFAYLFFASAMVGISAVFSELLTITALTYIGTTLFILAISISIYGILHGQKIIIKRVTVPLPHLPDAWREKTLLWISDLHLGQIYGKRFVENVVSKISELKPDVVCIGGDLFDGTKAPPLGEFLMPFRNLSVAHGIYFVSGNHEEFGAENAFFEAITEAGIHILANKMVDVAGLQLIGVDYRNTSKQTDFKSILSNINIRKDAPSILLKHEPKNLETTEEAGISLQISGHTHSGQQFPFGLIASKIYAGFAYGLKNFKHMQVFVSSGVGTWGPPLRIGSDSEIVVFRFSPAQIRNA